MKKLIIFFNTEEYVFGNSYIESYSDFNDLCERNDIDMYLVIGLSKYLGNKVFSSLIKVKDCVLRVIEGPIVADIVFHKGGSKIVVSGDSTMVNDSRLQHLCFDKLETNRIFSQCSAKTYEINYKNYIKVLSRIETDIIVVKPNFGSEGKDVFICPKKDFNRKFLLDREEVFIAQEYIDSSQGVPGIYSGRHEIRLINFNGKIKLSYIRNPAKGSFLSNIAQGAEVIPLPLTKIPKLAMDLARDVDKRFKSYYPRIYSVDIMYEGSKPKLVELNDSPGFPYRTREEDDHYYTKFHKLFLEALVGKEIIS